MQYNGSGREDVHTSSPIPNRDPSPVSQTGSLSLHQSLKRTQSTGLEVTPDANGPPTKKQKASRNRGVTAGHLGTKFKSQSVNPSTKEPLPVHHPPSSELASAMLSRAEDTGGARTVKLIRGISGSPTAVRASARGLNGLSSDHAGQYVRRRSSSSVDGSQLLGSIGITEVLHEDDRPTFIIDLANTQSNLDSDELGIIYANPSLKRRPGLIEYILGVSPDPTQMLNLSNNFTVFKNWALGEPTVHDGVEDQAQTCVFAGFDWAYSVVRRRLRIFRGRYVPELPTESGSLPNYRSGFQLYRALSSNNQMPPLDDISPGYFGFRASSRRAETPGALEALVHTSSIDVDDMPGEVDGSPASPLDNGDNGIAELIQKALSPSSEQRTLPSPNSSDALESSYGSHDSETGFFDWTRLPISPSLPSHIHFARSIDWASTSLGPIDQWSADLRGMCNLIMVRSFSHAPSLTGRHSLILLLPLIPPPALILTLPSILTIPLILTLCLAFPIALVFTFRLNPIFLSCMFFRSHALSFCRLTDIG